MATTNGELKIETGVPLPSANYASGGLRDTFNKMKPGDSVIVPAAAKSSIGNGALRAWGPKSYASRIQPNGSFRVWRIK